MKKLFEIAGFIACVIVSIPLTIVVIFGDFSNYEL
jgi:hypothetical protein